MTVTRRSLFADRLLQFPDLAFIDGAEFTNRGRWRSHFRRRIGDAFDDRIIFDIGCAGGELLVNVAAAHPRSAFVGLDWTCRSLFHAAEKVAAARLRNVTLLHARAQDLQRIAADGELNQIWLFHPEPCDTETTAPQRLFAEPFLLAAHRALCGGGRLVLKTDHAGYFQCALALLGETQPEAFMQVGQGGQPPIRIRKSELVHPDALPSSSPRLASCYAVALASIDYWNDAHAQAATCGHAFAGMMSQYEAQFRRKRWPIYYLELSARPPL